MHIFIGTLLLTSCNSPKSKPAEIKNDIGSTQQHAPNNTIVLPPKDSLFARISSDEYISMGDPDTALAVFLYKDYLKFSDDKESYISEMV